MKNNNNNNNNSEKFEMTAEQHAVLNDMKIEHPSTIDYVFALLCDRVTTRIMFEITSIEGEYIDILIQSDHNEYVPHKYSHTRKETLEFIGVVDDLANFLHKVTEFYGDAQWDLWAEKDQKDFREVY